MHSDKAGVVALVLGAVVLAPLTEVCAGVAEATAGTGQLASTVYPWQLLQIHVQDPSVKPQASEAARPALNTPGSSISTLQQYACFSLGFRH